jgi:flagellin-like hook-associated protein FlgL
MAEVSLSTAVRDSLLSLGDATKLIDQTQSRLSTGLRVAKATDDPVSFFQARALSDRAGDFNEKKDGIDQGISSLEVALNGIEAVEAIVRQIKGISTNLKGATGEQFTSLIAQFNNLRLNIGTLTDDATFNGINLITATAQTLDISFSAETASTLSVDAINISETGLSLGQAVSASDTSFNFTSTDFSLSTGFDAARTISVTYQGTGIEITGGVRRLQARRLHSVQLVLG